MTERITTDTQTIAKHAGYSAGDHLRSAVLEIDEQFGDGFAKANPELVGAFINAAAADYAGTIIAQQIREAIDGLTEAVRSLQD